MNNRTIDSMRPGEHGEHLVPRDGNVAQRQRENAAQAAAALGTHAARPLSAHEIAFRIGLPENAIYLIQKVLTLESQVLLLEADARSLSARLAKLENKS